MCGSNNLSTDQATLKLDGAISVRNILPVHSELLRHIDAHPTTAIDLPDGAQVDISFVQLLEAARLYATAKGGALTLARPAGPGLTDILRRAGFTDAAASDRAQFWFHRSDLQ